MIARFFGRLGYELRLSSNPVLYAVAAVYGVALVAGWVDPSAMALDPSFDLGEAAGLLITALVGWVGRQSVYTRKNVEMDGQPPESGHEHPPAEEG